MTKYQLAKILSYSKDGKVESRKRIQKIIYLLQSAGLALTNDFKLHHFGTYSSDVASLVDDLSTSGVLEEQEIRNGNVVQYNYLLSNPGKEAIDKLGRNPSKSIKSQLAEIESFQKKINALFDVDDLWILELGSTIAFYKSKGLDWSEANERACEFKKVSSKNSRSKQAFRLAKEIVA